MEKDKPQSCACRQKNDAPHQGGMSRRDFLKRTAVAASGVGSLLAAVSPLRQLTDSFDPEAFFQKHYKEMTPAELDRVITRIKEKVRRRYGMTPRLRDVKPMDGVEYVYALNLSRCNGSRRCVYACMKENNQSRDPQMQYISVLRMPIGTTDMERGTRYYDPERVPEEGYYYLPVQCQQCENPPCVRVCPVEATWQEPDGITVIDYDWCIGCRYCEAACPYWARRFNFEEPRIPAQDINPDMAYLSNRPRPKGVVEKCHFCLHRTREGRMPACLEACPTGARVFGNILDPNSEVSKILRTKRVFVLKEEAGTLPRFFYFFES